MPAKRATPAGEVRLGEQCELDAGQDAATVDRGDDDPAAGSEQRPRVRRCGRLVVEDRERQAVLGDQLLESGGRAGTVGAHDDPVAGADELSELGEERLSPAHRRRPRGRRDGRGVGGVGHRSDGPGRRSGVCEQAVEVDVQSGQVRVVVESPGAGEGPTEVDLLGKHVRRPVAQPPRLDEQDEPVIVEEVQQDVITALGGPAVLAGPGVVDEPREPRLHPLEHLAVGEALPLLPSPRIARDQALRAGTDGVGRQQLPCREQLHLRQVRGAALVRDGELDETVDLVTPEIDADRSIGRGREHVDDRTAHRDLTAVFDLVLAPVPRQHQPLDEAVLVDPVARSHDDRGRVLRTGTEALDECPHGCDDDLQRLVARMQAPHDPQPTPHRLDRRADAFERQGLPCREQLDGVDRQERTKVRREVFGVGNRRHRDDDRTATRQRGQPGDRRRPGHVGQDEHRRSSTERGGQPRFLAQRGEQRAERRVGAGFGGHGRTEPTPHPEVRGTALSMWEHRRPWAPSSLRSRPSRSGSGTSWVGCRPVG